MSYSYIVSLNGNINKFIDEECNELGNFSSPSEIVIEGLIEIYTEYIKSGIITRD